jgi:hypothetical protein
VELAEAVMGELAQLFQRQEQLIQVAVVVVVVVDLMVGLEVQVLLF